MIFTEHYSSLVRNKIDHYFYVAKQEEVITWIRISEALLYALQDMPRYDYISEIQILYIGGL